MNKLIIFDQEKVTVFHGSYQRFLEEIGWGSERELSTPEPKGSVPQPTNQRKALRREKAAIITRKSLVLRPLESTLARLEKTITARENELQTNNEPSPPRPPAT